jgi:2-polyprenyl-6-methoxyphenol hydroxylase-like FAD-dependent oxidoreductase
MPTPPSIAIIGAGPAGLTLALLLLKSRPSRASLTITIFDLDPSATARAHQGGTLDLHPQTGLAALKKCGLWEKALSYLRYDGEEMVIADCNGTEFLHVRDAKELDVSGKGKWDQRPEIDREKLKELLLEAVMGCGGEVRWGKKARSVVIGDEGQRVEFGDGEVEGPFDLVVGADGAWSKVRHALTDVRPRYSGICGVHGTIARPNEEFPEISKMVGRGSYFSYWGEKALMGQRLGDESIQVSCWSKRDKAFIEGVFKEMGDDLEATKGALLSEFPEWIEEMRDWVRACSSFQPWSLYELPVGHNWEHRKGLTLIGDAAHLCSPFAGLGVNAAMKDALDLSDWIIKSISGEITLDEAIAQFEQEMFPRMKEVQEHTMRNKLTMFSKEGPVTFMTTMVGVIGQEVGWPIDKGVLRWIPISKMAYVAFLTQGKLGTIRRWLRETFMTKSSRAPS